jgi:hypothetical protein
MEADMGTGIDAFEAEGCGQKLFDLASSMEVGRLRSNLVLLAAGALHFNERLGQGDRSPGMAAVLEYFQTHYYSDVIAYSSDDIACQVQILIEKASECGVFEELREIALFNPTDPDPGIRSLLMAPGYS